MRSFSPAPWGVPGRVIIGIGLAFSASCAQGHAQDSGGAPPAWIFTTRLALSGDSHESEPPDRQIYSGVALETAISRRLGRGLAAELTLRSESREVDILAPDGGEATRLGSVELLPLTLALLYRPAGDGSIHPYAGAGLNLTVCWEKSGALDSSDLTPALDPAIQAGVDFDLARSVLFNLGVRWNTYTADIETGGARVAEVAIDPLTFGCGVGFRF